MRVIRAYYWCSGCPGRHPTIALTEDYGVLLLRSSGAGTPAYVDTFADPVFDEVHEFVSRHLAGRREDRPGELVQRLFGVTVDPDNDGSPFVIGGWPTCPGCGAHTWWQISEPPEFLEVDLPHVKHASWEALSEVERRARLVAGLTTAPDRDPGPVRDPSRRVYLDLYFPPNLPLDREEIQAAIETDVGPVVTVVGAGLNNRGSNLDLEVSWVTEIDLVLRAVATTLAQLRVPDETLVAISDPPEKVELGELRKRYVNLT